MISCRKYTGALTFDTFSQFRGDVEHDEMQLIAFFVAPLPPGDYNEILEVYDACDMAASLSSADADTRLLRLLARQVEILKLLPFSSIVYSLSAV